MKRKFLTLTLLAAITISIVGSVVKAENNDKKILFRDIPWYSSKTEAEKMLTESGAEIESAAFKDSILRMSGIDFISITSGKDRVDGGGIVGRYSGLNVAGYEVTDTCACYIYELNSDGSVNRSVDDAKFYFGWYTFDSDNFADGTGIYNDLEEKLTSLYGTGISDDESEYHSTVTWYDDESNQIRLLLGGKDRDKQYVTLGYMASDANDRLDEMQAALDAEAMANEAAERENNKDNVSGL